MIFQDDLLAPVILWKVVPVDKLPDPAAVVTCIHPGQGGFPGDPRRRPAEYEITVHVLKQPSKEGLMPNPFADPANDWDEDDDYEYDDTRPVEASEDGHFDGVGLMVSESGALALAVACNEGTVDMYRVSDVEMRNLSAMIDAILD